MLLVDVDEDDEEGLEAEDELDEDDEPESADFERESVR